MNNDEFLQILIAQLQNQDPLNPTDSSQFVTELSQLTQVETLKNIQTDLDGMASASQMGQWASTIGDYMQVSDTSVSQGDRVTVTPPGSAYSQITLTLQSQSDGSTKQVTFNSGDSLVYTDNDQTSYTVTGATAQTTGGQSVSCATTVFRQICGVQTGTSGTVLVAGDGTTYATGTITKITK